jgi:hypothetical protein
MNTLFKLSTSALLLFSAVAAFAQGPPPCLELGCGGEKVKYDELLTDANEFCYRVKLTCTSGIEGGVGFHLGPDGGIGMGFFFGTTPDPQFCTAGGANVGNARFTRSCQFNNGSSVRWEVEAVKMKTCRDLPPSCPPPPP